MPIIPLKQGSDDWHNYRSAHIMGTDMPVILGSNPFKTRLELWEEKLNLRSPIQINAAMKRGQDLEPEARTLASSLITIEFEPCVYECDKYSWLASSLDGMAISMKKKFILEIKCPKESNHLDAINGIIPKYYLDQIQTQLLVTQSSICYYFSYRPEKKENPYAIIEIYPDLEKHEEIIAKGQEFYIQMCTMNPPEDWKLKIKKS